MIGGSLWLGIRAVQIFETAGRKECELLSRGLVIGTAAMLTAYFFATNQYEKQLWLLLAVGPALFSVALRTRTATVIEDGMGFPASARRNIALRTDVRAPATRRTGQATAPPL